MEIATIGFTRSSAESFFGRIASSGLPTVADIRRNNTSQLAGFAKKDDLEYLLEAICGAAYVEVPELAPERELLAAYRANGISWDSFAQRYRGGLAEAHVARRLDRRLFERGVVLLCSEPEPAQCHRRLAAEYLQDSWADVTIRHL